MVSEPTLMLQMYEQMSHQEANVTRDVEFLAIELDPTMFQEKKYYSIQHILFNLIYFILRKNKDLQQIEIVDQHLNFQIDLVHSFVCLFVFFFFVKRNI